jgi:hypothetical protein
MHIHQFPGIQIVGNDAKIRIGQDYYQIGQYENDNFVWSDYGAQRRDEMLGIVPEEARDSSVDEGIDLVEVPAVDESAFEGIDIDPAMEEAKARNAARLKKQKSKDK